MPNSLLILSFWPFEMLQFVYLMFILKNNSGGIPFVAAARISFFGNIIVLFHSCSRFNSRNIITFHLSFQREQVYECLIALFTTGSVTVTVFNVHLLTLATELLHVTILFNNSLGMLHHYEYVRGNFTSPICVAIIIISNFFKRDTPS